MTAKRGQHKPGTRGAWLFRYSEGSPTWAERRAELLVRVDRGTGWQIRHNGRRRACRSQRDRDILRAVAEGLIRITPRSGTAKFLELTDTGRAMLPQPAAAAPEPWAKRRAGIAEFKEANA